MLAQAAALAVLAALSPAALLLTTIYLSSTRPRSAMLFFLAGAIVTSVVAAVVLLVILRSGNLQDHRSRTPRYGLRTGLGFLMILVAGVLAARFPKRRHRAEVSGKGLVARMGAMPSPRMAFLTGLIVFMPSLTFIAAVQVIATARTGAAMDALGLIVVVAIAVTCIWLPFVVYLVLPDRTVRTLGAFNAWLREQGPLIVIGALAVGGVFLVVNGLLGLTGSG